MWLKAVGHCVHEECQLEASNRGYSISDITAPNKCPTKSFECFRLGDCREKGMGFQEYFISGNGGNLFKLKNCLL